MNIQRLQYLFIFSIGILATLLLQSFLFPNQFYVASLPDGSFYDGDIVDNKFNGHGYLVWDNENTYEGDFVDGLFHGKGSITYKDIYVYSGGFYKGKMTGEGRFDYSNGATYIGEVKNGEMDGEGELSYKSGGTYKGLFENGSFIKGSYLDENGDKYQGEFKDWLYHGKGVLRTKSEEKYIGNFEYGSLKGVGEYHHSDGSYYKGNFDFGKYQGVGELKTKNGDFYQGEFSYGKYSGKGKIVYAKPIKGILSRSGVWKNGRLIQSDDGTVVSSAKQLNEMALYNQNALLNKAGNNLTNGKKGKVELFFLGIAGDGSQSVFRKEVQFVGSLFSKKFKTKGKNVLLINSRETVKTDPLVTISSIKHSLNTLSKKMNDEDILFIYMTSHGSKKSGFSIRQPQLGLPNLSAVKLSNILRNTTIKWKVIVISACYSGQFIDSIKDEHTLIITASDKNSKSFGCSDKSDFTYFGDAYFNQALSHTSDFIEAFDLAVPMIKIKEKNKEYKLSNPQIHKPQLIIDQLKKWKKTLN